MNSLESKADCILSTGELQEEQQVEDSVLIAYSDLRIVNSKLVELNYTKDINRNLNEIVHNDSIIIKDLHTTIELNKIQYQEDINGANKNIKIYKGIGIGSIVLLIISLICR